ncbi:MAG TPA: hypothetical protein VK670_04785 [Silvibacterium sp.]|nr:hypothetical protein [Silvibacterium sp.]
MSYFLVGVGGTGAKLTQSLIHLSAAGLLPDRGRNLECLLVDPDKNNGNGGASKMLADLYKPCADLGCGEKSSLFSKKINVEGSWTPVEDMEEATLNTFFRYTAMQGHPKTSIDADLMELLFKPEERDLPIHEGFRGHPAIGAAIFAKQIDLEEPGSVWKAFHAKVQAATNAPNATVPLVLAGSIFGGTGAAGVPTICKLLDKEMTEKKLRLGMFLFLPYFQYAKVENQRLQADPANFMLAAREALNYYHDAQFLEKCDSFYTIGEQRWAEMPVSRVGGREQKNPAHFLELVAGLGAVRFMTWDGKAEAKNFYRAARTEENTVTWDDLPTADGQEKKQRELLQQMVLFAVMYHMIFYPEIDTGELGNRNSHYPYLREHSRARPAMNKEQVLKQLKNVEQYVQAFLKWVIEIATPWPGFNNGLVDLNVFATRTDKGWEVKTPTLDKSFLKQFDRSIDGLFLGLKGRDKPDYDRVLRAAANPVTDQTVSDAGYLVRAIYDACKFSK